MAVTIPDYPLLAQLFPQQRSLKGIVNSLTTPLSPNL